MSEERKRIKRRVKRTVEIRDEAKVVFAESIGELHQHHHQPPSFTPLGPFDSVPPLPGNFIARPELESIVDRLLSQPSSAALSALEGMGGVGKTVTALALCHNERVRAAFPDGIVWLTFGRQSALSLEERVKQVADAFNQQFRVYTEATYRSLLRDKAALIVLDDLWELSAAEPFVPPPGGSKLLYTSRNREIAAPLGAENFEIGILDSGQACTFLLRWSGRERHAPPAAFVEGILQECKGLVLALAMIGNRLRGQDDAEWSSALSDLEKARLRRVDRRPSRYEHETLYACIDVSVKALDSADREAYLKLAVLPEDLPAPMSLLQALWGGNADYVRGLARRLVDRCLAAWDAQRALGLHDLQLDYISGEYPDPAIFKLVRATIRRSLHVLHLHPEQFSSQVIGRLLLFENESGISSFISGLDANEPRPRLRPTIPALQPAGISGRILEGHSGSVQAVAISADGRKAITGSHDFTLRIWDLDRNTPPRILYGPYEFVTCADLSANGQRALLAYMDTVRVWDLESDDLPCILEGRHESVRAAALSMDGRRAITGSPDGTVRVWDLKSNDSPCILEGRHESVRAVALSGDGRRAFAGSWAGTVLVWELENNNPPRILEGPSDAVLVDAISVDARRAISGSTDNTMRVWDLEGSGSPRILEGHTDLVRCVAISADGRKAISGSTDNTVRVWDLEGNAPPLMSQMYNFGVESVAISADGRRAVSGFYDGIVRVWDLEGNAPPRVLEGPKDAVGAVGLSPDGRRAITGSLDGTVRIWDLVSNAPPRVLEGFSEVLNEIALSANGQRAVLGSFDGTVWVWDLEGNGSPRKVGGHSDSVSGIALSADGQRAISGSFDGTVRVWDLEGNFPARELEGHSDGIMGVALSGDGRRAVSGSADHTLRVWELESNEPSRILEAEGVMAVALAADGRTAVVGSYDRTVRVWNLEDNAPPRILRGHSDRVRAVALSPDGQRAVSGSDDKTVLVWDLQTERVVSSFTCDGGVSNCCWYSGLIVVVDYSGQMHVLRWEE